MLKSIDDMTDEEATYCRLRSLLCELDQSALRVGQIYERDGLSDEELGTLAEIEQHAESAVDAISDIKADFAERHDLDTSVL